MVNLTKTERIWKKLVTLLRDGFNSYPVYIMEALLAAVFVATHNEVAGAVVFVALISFLLVICDDVLPTTLPFLLMSAFLTNCYDSFNTFIRYIWAAPFVIMCLVYHFIRYRKPLKIGKSAHGILAVSVAISLGGIGNYSPLDYMRGAYYIFGLGFGMHGVYYLLQSQFFAKRDYDLNERFAVIMTIMGLFSAFVVGSGYFHKYVLDYKGSAYLLGFSRNNIATMMMFAMPFPLYLGRKKWWMTAFTPVIYAAICVTTSRGGLIFGSIEFAVCCAYWILLEEDKGIRKRRLLECLISFGVVLLVFGKIIIDVILNRIVADDVITGDVRFDMMIDSFEKFGERPMHGFGILDNDMIYAGYKKKGAMSWYHMMIPQIIASMGLMGVAAYGFQFFGRCKLIFTKKCAWSLCLGISYLGVLLMSQVNPGEFCPVPFEMLAVLLFILQERRFHTFEDLPLNGVLREKINREKRKILL